MSREALYSIRSISAKSSDASSLIDELDHYLNGLYPSESNHLESPQNLDDPNCIFLGAFKDEKLIAMGAAKLMGDYAELKRFFVTKDFRGTGVAECILSVLEMEALKKDITNIYLETGIHQLAALKFYQNLGYVKCEPFGKYTKDPLSIFMNKNIGECEFILNDSQDTTISWHFLVG